MEVAVISRNVTVAESVRDLMDEKLDRVAHYLDGIDHAEVRFQRERNPRIAESEVCEVTLRGRGHVVRAKASATEQLAALDLVIGKLQHRMEKMKGRMLIRKNGKRSSVGAMITSQHVNPDFIDISDGRGGVDVLERIEKISGDEPQIVRTKQFDIKPMIPEEAVLQMDLLGHDFFLFTNADTGCAAVVYKRSDNHVGLIDAVS